MQIRRLGVVFLRLQGIAAALWWFALLLEPRLRQPFLAPSAPTTTLLTLIVADLIFFVGGSLLSAHGLARQRAWAWPILCIHAGAASYAALSALTLSILTDGAWLGALLMAPSLVVPLALAWRLRPPGFGGRED